MDQRPNLHPTFAAELLAARSSLTVGDQVGLALRATRYRLRLSQRAYAALRGWTASRLARLEVDADRLRLGEVVAALDGTEYLLALCHRPVEDGPPDPLAPTPAGAALPVPVRAAHWARTELVARIRDGTRRFPAHHDVQQVGYPPRWWWSTESARAGTVPPHWTAPRPWAEPSAGAATPEGADEGDGRGPGGVQGAA